MTRPSAPMSSTGPHPLQGCGAQGRGWRRSADIAFDHTRLPPLHHARAMVPGCRCPGAVRAKGMIDATVLRDGDRYYVSPRSAMRQIARPATYWRRPLPRFGPMVRRVLGRSSTAASVAAPVRPKVEGPTAFRANPGDTSGFRYFLWVDNYGGVGYIPLATQSLDGKIAWTYPASSTCPSPRDTARCFHHRGRARCSGRALGPRRVRSCDRRGSLDRRPGLASGTRLPVPVGHVAAWRADGRDLRDGMLTNTTADTRMSTLRAC